MLFFKLLKSKVMKNLQKIVLLIIVTLFSFSCDDLIEVAPTSVITAESFWKTENDAEGALVGMYAYLRNIANADLFYLGEARADVITLGTVGEGGWSKYYYNSLNPDDAGPSWQSFYTLINAANLIIKYVPDIDFTSGANKNNILAQAYTMRAWAYFTMTKTWGDLIIRTEPSEGFTAETTQKERIPQSEVFNLIKSDIEEALGLFPNNNFPQYRSFWSKPATNALKADVYLWTGKRLQGGDADIQVALNSLNEIESSDVELLQDYESVFDYSNKGNKEILMAVRFYEDEVGSNIFRDMYLIMSAVPTNIDQATRDKIGALGGGSNNITVPTDYYKSLFSEDDQRKDASFFEIYRLDDQNEPTDYYTTIVTKFSGTVIGGSRAFLDDIILYRYADVLLLKAEAKNALNEDPSNEINEIRMRAYGDNFESYEFVSETKEENDYIILEERLRELGFEGKRWWDLIRFGKAIELLPELQNKNNPEHLLLWPISNSVLSLEVLVEQNPGYAN
jgi:hypothetical protein